MSSDNEELDENPVVTRHRKEKKELRAKVLSMKKAAKSGNKQKQKETNAECEKLEKEQAERHKNELAASEDADGAGPAPPVPAPAAPVPEEVPEGEDDGDDKEDSSCGQFYKSFKISNKAAKRQAKKKEQDDRMKTAQQADKEMANKQSSEKYLEKSAIKELLSEQRLKMVEIAADGDCLYNSLVHQLQEDGIETTTRKLRKHCAAFMRERKEEFVPFIALSDTAATGSESVDNFEEYMYGVEHCAEVGGVWGGEVELCAISRIYKKMIIIYKTDGERRLGEEFDAPGERPLRIVYLRRYYTLGEHYNSTCSA